MKKISEIQNNIENYLNEENLYGWFYINGNLNEMARAGKIPKTKFEIHLEGGEGNIPHIHICKKSGKNIVLRLCLLKNEYFREKDDLGNILNSKERKALNDYMKSSFNDEFNINMWQHLCTMWNQYNPAHLIKNIKSLKQPDYNIINESK